MFLSKIQRLFGAVIIPPLCAFAFFSFNSVSDSNEYQIKAMFIYNFTKYVEWPEENSDTVFRIGILGKSDIMEPLQEIASQKKAGEKKIEIVLLESDNEPYCQIIFVTRSQLHQLDFVERKYAGKNVLVITDESERPAAINLVTRGNKVRFEINQSLAKSGGIKISSKLFTLAIAVHP